MNDGIERRSDITTRGGDDRGDLDDEISFTPYFKALWAYRRVIVGAVAGVSTLFLVGILLVYLRAPVERIGSIQFRLLFDRAERGEYPNGTLFSASEIVAGPVLTEVFAANDLQRFGRYEDFQTSVYVLQSNPAVALLEYEYQALLADVKLSAVDRARIQDDFKKKREALVDPVYTISMRRHERLTTLPRDLMNKVLLEVLNTWARQAEERKGATKYNVGVLSPKLLQRESLDRDDYLVAIDILRAKTSRVLGTIAEIATLPGATTIRVGPDRVSLAEVQAALEDVVRFKLEPLLGLIRSQGITKNAQALSLYAENQLFQLHGDQQESIDRVQAMRESIREFSAPPGSPAGETRGGPTGMTGGGVTMTPQLDQSFLDWLMSLSTAKDVLEYKRRMTDRVIEQSETMAARKRETAYYEDLVKELKTSRSGAQGSPELLAIIKSRSADAFAEIVKGIEQTALIYQEISALNLNPSTTLFKVISPFSLQTQRSLSARTAGVYYLLVIMLTLIVVPIGCLIHDAIRRHGSRGHEVVSGVTTS